MASWSVARLLNLSDRMEGAMGRISSDPVLWGDADDLETSGRAVVAFGALAGQQWTSTGHGAQAQTHAITSGAGWLLLSTTCERPQSCAAVALPI